MEIYQKIKTQAFLNMQEEFIELQRWCFKNCEIIKALESAIYDNVGYNYEYCSESNILSTRPQVDFYYKFKNGHAIICEFINAQTLRFNFAEYSKVTKTYAIYRSFASDINNTFASDSIKEQVKDIKEFLAQCKRA